MSIRAGGTVKLAGAVLIAAFLFTPAASARDLWIVHGKATTPLGQCSVVAWAAGGVLHNITTGDLTARVLHVSSGGLPVPTTALTVPARRSLPAHPRGINPFVAPSLYVMRIDAPEGLIADARLELWALRDCPPQSPPPAAPFSKVPMPVFERLAEAGEEQVLVGTDLASQPSRLNVGIYNAGAVEGHAIIRVHAPFCAQADLGSTTAVVAPDTLVQVRVEALQPCGGDPETPGWATYVTVTVDQPSLSFVSVLSNELPPTATTHVAGPSR